MQKTLEKDNENEKELSFTAEEARILIVDDTKINLMVATALFKPIKMQIDVANDGYEALSKTKEQKYDLIFMDYFMPCIDGAETTRQVRADEENLNKEVPIIALTADAMSGVREKLLEQGMNDFLSKPIEIKHAYQALYEWLPKDKIRES